MINEGQYLKEINFCVWTKNSYEKCKQINEVDNEIWKKKKENGNLQVTENVN